MINLHLRKTIWLLALLSPVLAWAEPPAQPLRPWLEYRAIMWIGDTAYRKPEKLPLFFQRLREMGINTAMVYGDGNLQPVLENHFPYYVENIVNRGLCLKFNSEVTDWDKFVTDWVKNGRPESALVRDYCLDAPDWRAWATQEVQKLARKNKDHQPLAYNIRDELSTTISANPFDYDFSPLSLAKFRDWLKTQYPSLDALNSEWATQFKSWEEVRPFTTDQIKNRMASGEALPHGNPDWQQLQQLKFNPTSARQSPTRWNLAPWADFRTYMDLALARALDDLRQATHAVDPQTPVGIEGTQMPNAFGGYDLWRLAQALDWVEPYDIGCAREIFGSFMPGKPLLTTVFESKTDPARRRLWHLLLEGDHGCIIWWSEDCVDWASGDYQLTPKAKALAPVLQEMSSPLARLFLRAQPERDPVFVLYSQPSIQVDWLIESTVDGSTWLRRFSSFEADHNWMAKVRNAWLKAFQDLGYSPQFLSSAELENGVLGHATNAVLVLPTAYALSDKEATQIRSVLNSRTSGQNLGQRHLFADGFTGLFDQHGKLRAASVLPELGPPSPELANCVALGSHSEFKVKPADLTRFGIARRQAEPASEITDWIRAELAGMPAEVSLPVSARARVHRFRIGANSLLAFERNIDYQMSEELKQAGGNEALEKPIELEATLKQPAHIYDLRTQRYLGHTNRIRFTLDPWQPSLYALTQTKYDEKSIVNDLAN